MNTMSKKQTLLSLYLPAFLIPVAVTGVLLMLYSSGMGNLFPDSLSLYSVILSGIASLSFMIYLRKSEQYHNLTGTWYVLASISYGLCSHALLPTAEYSAQIIFAILPLLILSFEAFIFSQKTLYFLLILSLCLFINTITTSGIMIGLIVAFFFFTPQKKGALLADFCHLLLLYVLSICISAAVSLPTYKNWFALAAEQTYTGFSLAQPLANFVSRFLPGAIPTTYYTFSRNVYLYFGLFFFFMFVLYFFHNGISCKERFKTLGFLCVILCAIEFSPFRFIFELFTENSSFVIYFECLFIFWSVKLATKVLSSLTEIRGRNLVLSFLCSALILLYGYAGSYLNFHPTAALTSLLFAALYILCTILSWKRIRTDFMQLLLCLFIVLELFCNCILVTNLNLFSPAAISENHFIWEQAFNFGNTEDENGSSVHTISPDDSAYLEQSTEYQAFFEEHTDEALMSLLTELLSKVELTKEDFDAYNPYSLLNPLEQANAACRKLGTSDDLFIPCDIQLTFPPSDYYKITEQGGGVYNLFQHTEVKNLTSIYIDYNFTTDRDGTFVFYDNMNAFGYTFDSCRAGEVQNALLHAPVTTTIALNFQLIGYQLNSDVYNEISDLLATYQESSLTAGLSMGIYYCSIALTCVGVLILLVLYFNRDKEPIIRSLYSAKHKLASLQLWNTLGKHFSNNYVYYLAFGIPVILYVTTMIVFSCIPFGSNSFYDEDGIASSLPSIMSAYYNIKNGNTLFSMLGGYGYSPYMANTNFIFRAVFTLFPANYIPALILFLEALSFGLSSLSMVYYLTHRLTGTKAHKKDYRVLIPAFIYALNTYMLASHCFPTWYYVFYTLPLLLLAMDYLMYKKTWALYVLTLGFCIFTNIHLSIFVCFFLIIWFFTYHFDNIKDFFFKGLRFGIFSLIAAGCNFFKLSETFMSKTDSFYQEADSVLPTFGLHTSFFEQWKQLFVFTPSMAVNDNEGFINLYMGILTLILLGLYITSKRISLKKKLSRLIPIAILTISFNEQVLSYIWNGFHYQSNVPNRYVFLLMFLCAIISYDAIIELKHTSLLKHGIICILLGIFLTLCHIWCENTTSAFVCSLILIVAYAITHFIYKKLKHKKLPYYRIVIAFLLLELGANMFFTTSNYQLTAYTLIGSFDQLEEFANSKLDAENTLGRISTPGISQINFGMIHNIPSGSFFNSYVTAYQCQAHYTYGFLSGRNFTTYNYNSTPLGMSLSGHKYFFLPLYGINTLADTIQYNYIGQYANYYIYENPNVLSLGIYAPETILNLSENVNLPPLFHNELVNLYTQDNIPVYTIQPLTYTNDVENTPNSFSYLDQNRESISAEEAQKILDENLITAMYATRELYLHMNLMPVSDGMTYLYQKEFVPLTSGTAGTPIITESMYPNYTDNVSANHLWLTFNQEVFENFINIASQNQMEDVIIDNNHIYGTTRYENAGYTMLSLPYDRGWRAFVDGEEVVIESPYNSFMLFRTPAGEHHIELVYERPGMKTGIYFSIGFTLFVMFIYILSRILPQKKNGSV